MNKIFISNHQTAEEFVEHIRVIMFTFLYAVVDGERATRAFVVCSQRANNSAD